MKTAELTGARLDYWVAKAEGIEFKLQWPIDDPRCWLSVPYSGSPDCGGEIRKTFAETGGYGAAYLPSSAWEDGGPIFERNTEAILDCAGYTDMWPIGPELLPFLMRAYVASKFGDEVPDL